MKKLNIDLDSNHPELNGDINPATAEREPNYPTVHIEDEDSLADLGVPDKGTMTVEYEIVRETNSKRKDGSDWYSCDVEIRKIISAAPEKDISPTKRDTSASDALDKLAKEKSDEEGY